jgi:acyl dehydratase
MTIVYEKLMALDIPPAEQTYTSKDCMLYALGIGLGHDPMNEDELPFVYEKNLKVLPTMAAVLGYVGFWARDRDTGIDWVKIVNGEQGVILHKPLAGQGTVIGRQRIVEVIDKGAGKGALVYSERKVSDKATGDLIDLGTRPEAALIYRLSGDRNPLHAEPAFAKQAGYPRPIMHGLGNFGISGHAVLKTFCGYDPTKLASFACRFSAPVFPGETLCTEMWRDGAVVSFRAKVVERDVVAVNNGRAEVTP